MDVKIWKQITNKTAKLDPDNEAVNNIQYIYIHIYKIYRQINIKQHIRQKRTIKYIYK